MSAFAVLRLAHVVGAVLGGGLVAGIAIVAPMAARGAAPSTALLVRLTRWASLGLAVTFLTGIGLDIATGGSFHEHVWFRVAGVSMVVAGALLGVMRRRVRRVASGDEDAAALRVVPYLAYGACAVVTWITVLMELRPF